jgi:replicative DNA helicase
LKDDGTDSEVQRVTRISRSVKALGREFDCPVLVLSQLNRAVELRDDQHPKLHDLRESGAIEQDADIVIGLKRELGTREMDIEVLKNRQGPVGLVKVEFDFTTMTFPPYNAVKEAVS